MNGSVAMPIKHEVSTDRMHLYRIPLEYEDDGRCQFDLWLGFDKSDWMFPFPIVTASIWTGFAIEFSKIETREFARRRGFAKELCMACCEYYGTEIRGGVASDEGQKLLDSIQRECSLRFGEDAAPSTDKQQQTPRTMPRRTEE